jgi:hypothetical protein
MNHRHGTAPDAEAHRTLIGNPHRAIAEAWAWLLVLKPAAMAQAG